MMAPQAQSWVFLQVLICRGFSPPHRLSTMLVSNLPHSLWITRYRARCPRPALLCTLFNHRSEGHSPTASPGR